MCRLAFACIALCSATGLSAFAQSANTPQSRCTALSALTLDHAKVLTAALTAPAEAIPEAKLTPARTAALPAFCRVRIEDRPSADSDIRTEVWLPANAWNGRFRGEGNGGFAGEIYYPQMATSVAAGYATAGTDTGHAGTDGTFALGHPEKIKDFGWRSIHDMTLEAGQVIAAFYGKPASHSYFVSCSDGGREALMEAQRFPTDYDGIVAGAPAYYWTGLVSVAAGNEKQLYSSLAAAIPAAKVSTIANAVRAACDANDGVTDGVLNDPRACTFNPATLLCRQGDSDSCLTTAQVASLKTIYAAKRGAHGKVVYPGFLPGAEDAPLSWDRWITGEHSLQLFFATGYFSNFVYQDPNWKLSSFDFPRDSALAAQRNGADLNATDTNLKPFLTHGGRLILYHGFNDPAIPAVGTIQYLDSVIATVGRPAVSSGIRLYMVPGMLHCSGGPGATDFGQDQDPAEPFDAQHNIISALEQWVEQGAAPDTIIATKFPADDPTRPARMTRPLCPYPALPSYVSGDPNNAKSFTCAIPKP
jgi:feruloyl esterase